MPRMQDKTRILPTLLLNSAEAPTFIVATKTDKPKKSQRKRQFEKVREALKTDDNNDGTVFFVVGVSCGA